MEFSRDRKSMGVYCMPVSDLHSNGNKIFVKGAPESIIERCNFVRIGKDTVPMTKQLREGILQQVNIYGTGKFFLF